MSLGEDRDACAHAEDELMRTSAPFWTNVGNGTPTRRVSPDTTTSTTT
jgi:hypothetical protein